jgi:hypothetical protein
VCYRKLSVTKTGILLVLFMLTCSVSFHPVSYASDAVVTPAYGTPERRDVLDGLRREVFRLHGIEVIFTVRTLKVSKGWAWVQTAPQSKDGRSRYEDLFALLRYKSGRWQVAELACTEPDNTECIDDPDYFKKLRKRFPGLPPAILPE